MLIIYNNNYSGLISAKRKSSADPGTSGSGSAGPAAGVGPAAPATGDAAAQLDTKMNDLRDKMVEIQNLLAAATDNSGDNSSGNVKMNEQQLRSFMRTFEQTGAALKTFEQARKSRKAKEIDRFPIGLECAKNNVLAHAIILYNDSWCANEDIREQEHKQRFQWIKRIVGDPEIWTVANHMYEKNTPKQKLAKDMEREVDTIHYHGADIKGYSYNPMEIQLKSKKISNKDVYNCIWFDSDIGNELVLYENYTSRVNKNDAKDYRQKFVFFFKENYKMLAKIFQPLYYDGQTSPLVKLNLTDSKKNERNKCNMSKDYVLRFIHERFKNLLYWVKRETGKKSIFETMHKNLLEDGESTKMLLEPDKLTLENKNLLVIHKDLIKFWCFFLKTWFAIIDSIDSNTIQHTTQHLRNEYVKSIIEQDIGLLLKEYKKYDIELDESLYLVNKNLDEMFSTVLINTNIITTQIHEITPDTTEDKLEMKNEFIRNGIEIAEVIYSYVFQNGVPVAVQIERFSMDIHDYFKANFYTEGTKFIYFEDSQPGPAQRRNQSMWYSVDNKKELSNPRLQIKLTKDPSTGKIYFEGKELHTHLDTLFEKRFSDAMQQRT